MESLKRKLHDDIIRRWVHVRTPGHELYGEPDFDTSHIESIKIGHAGDLQSYGSHFPLAEAITDRRGKTRLWLLNGDTWGGSGGWGNSTSTQQAQVRRLVGETDIPSVVIPFSVLDEAGIDHASVRALDVSKDRTEYWTETRTEFPPGAVWQHETETLPGSSGWRHSLTGEWRDGTSWERPEPAEPRPRWDTVNTPWEQHRAEIDAWEKRVGEWKYTSGVEKNTGRKALRVAKNSWQTWDLVDDGEGGIVYERERSRHWLGESLIEATVHYTTTPRCPRCKGKGVFEGDVRGQWVSVEGPVREYGISPLRGTIDVPSCNDCGGQRRVTARRTRKAKFLSGFDHGETRPSYFFCELPKMSEQSIVAAYDALKPTTVLLAEQFGREVKRQGDIYAVPIALDKRALRAEGARFGKQVNILNTNHVATEVAQLRDGRIFARGTLKHAPQFRRPDHRRVPLGKDWHLIVKNTVPVAANR